MSLSLLLTSTSLLLTSTSLLLISMGCLADQTPFTELVDEFRDIPECEKYVTYLDTLRDTSAECVSEPDDALRKGVNALTSADISSTESCLEAFDEGTCNLVDSFTIECSCETINCFGGRIAVYMSEETTAQDPCTRLKDEACPTYKLTQEGACERMEMSIKDLFSSDDTSKIFKGCDDACVIGESTSLSSMAKKSLFLSIPLLLLSLSH